MSDFPENRWEIIKQIWRDENNRWLYALTGFILGCLFFPFILVENDILASLFPEALGIFFTVLVIDTIYHHRAEAQEIKRLVRQLKSEHNFIALNALEELGDRVSKGHVSGQAFIGSDLRNAPILNADFRKSLFLYTQFMGVKISGSVFVETTFEMSPLQNSKISNSIFDGSQLNGLRIQNSSFDNVSLKSCSLRNSDFTNTSLHHVDLQNSDIQSASFLLVKFFYCNLSGLDFSYQNLQDIQFIGCDLSNTIFVNAQTFAADFSRANLTGADLRRMDLDISNLTGVDLTDADLTHAFLTTASMDKTTILPDGSSWTPETDIARFTDPSHEKYWRSSDPRSPAYSND